MENIRIIEFLLRAKKFTQTNRKNPTKQNGEITYGEKELFYANRYHGIDNFSGTESLYENDKLIWTLNYAGRIMDKDEFSEDFLSLALSQGNYMRPYRGPGSYELDGLSYESMMYGDFHWFVGLEMVHNDGNKVYECAYHGGDIR
jgi:hypothetical protein